MEDGRNQSEIKHAEAGREAEVYAARARPVPSACTPCACATENVGKIAKSFARDGS